MKFKNINPLRQNSNRDPCWGNVIHHCSEDMSCLSCPEATAYPSFFPQFPSWAQPGTTGTQVAELEEVKQGSSGEVWFWNCSCFQVTRFSHFRSFIPRTPAPRSPKRPRQDEKRNLLQLNTLLRARLPMLRSRCPVECVVRHFLQELSGSHPIPV